jgi:hypothetical protein
MQKSAKRRNPQRVACSEANRRNAAFPQPPKEKKRLLLLSPPAVFPSLDTHQSNINNNGKQITPNYPAFLFHIFRIGS